MRAMVAVIIFGGGVAQTTLAPTLRVGGMAPDLPLIVVILLALRKGPELGCLAGFAAGLLQDFAAGGFLGAQALTKAMVGFFVGVVAGRLWVQNPLVQIPGLVSLSVAEGFVRFALLQLFHFPAPFADLMLYVVLPQALYNGVVGAAIVLAVGWLEGLRGRWS
jgi:rod shape-determining protein MreD